MLWPDATDDASRASLNVAVSSLRRQLEAGAIPADAVVNADRQFIGFTSSVRTDVAVFEGSMMQARRLAATDPPRAAEQYTSALELYHSDLLPGYFEDWIYAERDKLAVRMQEGLLWLKQWAQSGGDLAAEQAFARLAARFDPAGEWSGEMTAAFKPNLQPAVAVESSVHRRTFEQRTPVTSGGAPPGRSASGSDAPRKPTTQRGPRASNRQAGPEATSGGNTNNVPFEPLQTPPPDKGTAGAGNRFVNTTNPRPPDSVTFPFSEIPVPITQFYGRGREMSQLLDWFNDRSARLLTISGMGGIGKTRLAREVCRLAQAGTDLDEAEQTSPNRPAVVFAEASQAATIADLERSIAQALGDFSAGPPEMRSLLARGGRIVLLLDNVDPMMHGDEADSFRAWLTTLLSAARNVNVMLTSRTRTGVDGEKVFPLGPLAEEWFTDGPSGEAGAQGDGPLALFCDRARSALPDWSLSERNAADVNDLIALLDGIPLAIELAAARMSVLTPARIREQIAERRFEVLRHKGHKVAARHQSLRTTIAWSYGFLQPALQAAFARLSVFRGGFSLEAAAGAWGQTDILETADDLQELVMASMVVPDLSSADEYCAGRFRILDTLREFGGEKLAEMGVDTEARHRHAAYYRDWSRAMVPLTHEPSDVSRYAELRIEWPNLQAALQYFEEKPAVQTDGHDEPALLDFASSLIRFWVVCGPVGEGRRFLESGLARHHRQQTPHSPRLMVSATNSAAILAMQDGDWEAARRWLRQLTWLTRAGSGAAAPDQRAAALHNWGLAEAESGNFDKAEQCFSEAIGLWEMLNEQEEDHIHSGALAAAWSNKGKAASLANDWSSAAQCYETSLAVARAANDLRAQGIALRHLGECRRVLAGAGSLEAETLCHQSLELLWELGNMTSCAHTLIMLAHLAAERGDLERAAWLGYAAREGFSETGVPVPQLAWKATATVPPMPVAIGARPVSVRSAVERVLGDKAGRYADRAGR